MANGIINAIILNIIPINLIPVIGVTSIDTPNKIHDSTMNFESYMFSTLNPICFPIKYNRYKTVLCLSIRKIYLNTN